MAGKIKARDIEEVKTRVNIADVIGEYVSLRPASAGSLKGLCPFHDEKSPSFNVRPAQGFYHCFGCGEGGDVYKFIQQLDQLSFTEAVEKLASRIGFELSYEEGGASPETGQKSRVLEANSAAALFYQEQLMKDAAIPGREFLKGRGFDKAAAEQFGIGFAPKGWNGLFDHLTKKGFTIEELVTAGLVTKSDRGAYDKFRGRLIWPIRDTTSQVIGFGARKLFDDDQGPKYLNTSDTLVYHKSQVLYGIDLAKKDISKQQRVVVVEGYTDVMACHLAGVTTAVATCGTAFGDDHIRIINRMLSADKDIPAEVIFTFDPDAAGQKAAMRAFADSAKFTAQTFVAVGPDGLDPCDLRTAKGDEAVVAMIEVKNRYSNSLSSRNWQNSTSHQSKGGLPRRVQQHRLLLASKTPQCVLLIPASSPVGSTWTAMTSLLWSMPQARALVSKLCQICGRIRNRPRSSPETAKRHRKTRPKLQFLP